MTLIFWSIMIIAFMYSETERRRIKARKSSKQTSRTLKLQRHANKEKK